MLPLLSSLPWFLMPFYNSVIVSTILWNVTCLFKYTTHFTTHLRARTSPIKCLLPHHQHAAKFQVLWMVPVLGLIIITCFPLKIVLVWMINYIVILSIAVARYHLTIVRQRKVCAYECNTKRKKNWGSTLESARFPGALREESSDTESNQRVKVLSMAEI